MTAADVSFVPGGIKPGKFTTTLALLITILFGLGLSGIENAYIIGAITLAFVISVFAVRTIALKYCEGHARHAVNCGKSAELFEKWNEAYDANRHKKADKLWDKFMDSL